MEEIIIDENPGHINILTITSNNEFGINFEKVIALFINIGQEYNNINYNSILIEEVSILSKIVVIAIKISIAATNAYLPILLNCKLFNLFKFYFTSFIHIYT
jgi:hypothetical protein